MKCMYCGQDNPDGEVFCVCGRPLTLGGGYGTQAPPFPFQTPDQVKHRKALPKGPIILLLIVLLGVGGFFYYRHYMQSSMTDESKWQTINGNGYSITVPKVMKKSKMLTVEGSEMELLDFYTSEDAGFDVSVYRYSEEEKSLYGKLGAKDYRAAMVASGRTVKINDQKLDFKVREDENYLYAGYNVHRANHIGKSDDVYYIEAMYPCDDCYYQVDVYCAESDKSKYESIMLKWLDSFEEN